jgi:hypothetical protein
VRRAAALAAALVVSLAGGPVAVAQPDPAETAVRVDVRGLTTALVPGSTEALTIRARAVNTSAEPLRRLKVGLRFGQPLRGRSSIAIGGAPARLGLRAAEQTLGDGELAAGATADANFDVKVEDLPFRNSKVAAVYPLRIEVRARFRTVGAADTYVVWWPERSPAVRIAWVWPLVEQSHRGIGQDFYDDDLAASVDDGRLDTLLHVGATSRVPLTWADDPELVDSLHRMTQPYTVRGEEGTSGAAAREWLDRARGALRDATVLPLPYDDPDLGAVAEGALAADAARSFRLGRELLRRDLGTAGSAQLAWPPAETLEPAVESLLSAQGVKGVVVPYSALPLSEPLYYTPTAPTPLAEGALGSMTALVADPQLAGFVAAGSAAGGSRLAVQRFLADTAMIALERPGDLRDVVVTPPRVWDPVRDYATQLLRQTREAPWLRPVGLDDVLTSSPSAAARTRTPPGPDVLPGDQLRRVLAERRGLQRLRGVLTDPKRAPDELADLDDALLRSLSAAWGTDPGAGHRLTNSVDAEVGRQVERLRVVVGGVVTMTGRSGGIPVTFQNDFGQPVRVRVRVATNDRLRLADKAYESARGQEVTVPPGSYPLVIHGKATTGGLFPVTVEVLGTDGGRLGPVATLKVRSTAYGAVALVVTGVAFGLLLVGSATRLLGRRRKARPPSPTPEPVAA